MRILEFIFKLLWQFITFEPGRFEELKDKAYLWQNQEEAKINTDQEKWYHKVLAYDKLWWFQVGLAIFFLFAFKSVRAWLMDDPINGDYDEDDEDGEDDVKVRRKVAMSNFKF